MNIPDILPIKRMEDYHTHYVGRCSDGRQFFGQDGVWVFLKPGTPATDPDFLNLRGEYVILHIFDKDGNYISTQHWYAGTSADSTKEIRQAMTDTLEKWIDELGAWEFADIAVKLFQVDIDGFIFGLVPDEETGFINLMPGKSIAFYEPWEDGEYWT